MQLCLLFGRRKAFVFNVDILINISLDMNGNLITCKVCTMYIEVCGMIRPSVNGENENILVSKLEFRTRTRSTIYERWHYLFHLSPSFTTLFMSLILNANMLRMTVDWFHIRTINHCWF